jgi:hypothetical protein
LPKTRLMSTVWVLNRTNSTSTTVTKISIAAASPIPIPRPRRWPRLCRAAAAEGGETTGGVGGVAGAVGLLPVGALLGEGVVPGVVARCGSGVVTRRVCCVRGPQASPGGRL